MQPCCWSPNRPCRSRRLHDYSVRPSRLHSNLFRSYRGNVLRADLRQCWGIWAHSGGTLMGQLGHCCSSCWPSFWNRLVTFVGHVGHVCGPMWVTFVCHVDHLCGAMWVTCVGHVCWSCGPRLWGNMCVTCVGHVCHLGQLCWTRWVTLWGSWATSVDLVGHLGWSFG